MTHRAQSAILKDLPRFNRVDTGNSAEEIETGSNIRNISIVAPLQQSAFV
jgi:hypothetical protein